MLIRTFAGLILLFLLFGCSSFNYIGETYSETNEVDIFYSIDEIKSKHKVFGHIVGTPNLFEDFITELKTEAKIKGADAVVINEIDYEYGKEGKSEKIKAMFIKYMD